MARISYPTKRAVSGPWLIDADRLIALDDLFDQYTGQFLAQLEENLRAEAEADLDAKKTAVSHVEVQRQIERLRAYKGKENRSLGVYLKGGKTLNSHSFREALTLPNLNSEEISGFHYSIRLGEYHTSVSLRSSWGPPELLIDVEPGDSSLAQEFYSALENWLTDFAPSRPAQIWRKYVSIFGFLPVCVWMVFWALFFIAPSTKNIYRADIQRVLNEGVTQKNQDNAIELILRVVSEEATPNKSVSFKRSVRGWGYLLGISLILFALSLCPAVVIGVWGGKQKIKLWRRWITFLWITIPALILTTVLWPRILMLLGI